MPDSPLDGSFRYSLQQLRPYARSCSLATAAALPLGVLAAVEGLLIAQFLTLFGQPGVPELNLASMFDPKTGARLNELLGGLAWQGAALWIQLPLALLALNTLKNVLQSASFWSWELNGERISRDIRRRLTDRYLSLSHFTRMARGGSLEQDLAPTLTNDVKVMREYVVHFFGGLPREISKFVFFLVLLVLLSPLYLFYTLALILPAALLVRRLGKKLRRRSRTALDQFAEVSEWIRNRMQGMETIKHYGTEAFESTQMAAFFDRLTRRFMQAARTKAMSSPLVELFGTAGAAVVLHFILSAVLAGGGDGPGTGISFITLLGLMGQAANQISRYYSAHKEASSATDRIHSLEREMQRLETDDPPATAGILLATTPGGGPATTLSMQGVSFRYPGSAGKAVADFSFDFKPNRFYTILGQTGSGKSTLLRLLMGIYPPDSGRRRIVEEDFGYLPQHLIPAAASIAENIAYPNLTVDMERLNLALARAQASAFVDSLPERADTGIGGGGRQLSGGQMQRIMLARLFYHDKRVTFIDEGTSALDQGNEQLVLQSLKAQSQAGTTIIMITHRLSALAYSDESLVLAGGRLRFAGPTATLSRTVLTGILTDS